MNLLKFYLNKHWPLILLALLLAAINQVFSLLDPYIFNFIIDDYVTRFEELSSEEFIHGVGNLLLLAVGVAFVSRVAKNFQDYFVNVITQKVGTEMYADGIRHSLSLPYQDFEDQKSGETLGRLQKVRSDVEKLISSFVNILFTSLIAIVFVTIYAVRVHWLIAPVYFGIIPVLGFVSSVLSKKVKKIQKKIVAETTALAGSTTESLRNIEIVKSLGLANQEIKRLNTNTGKILELELKKVKYVRSLSFVQGTLVNLLRTAIMFMMLYLIFTRQISIGQFFTLFIYSFYIFGPLQELGNLIGIYREAEVSLHYYQELLLQKSEPRPENPKSSGIIRSMEMKSVSFFHRDADSPAVKDISFHLNSGETIAFVGPSGSGKTTLVKLMSGLYRPRTGDILFNGISIHELLPEEIRSQLGLVTQDPQLFSGSLRDNLKFVAPDASDEDCLEVLNKAALQSLLARAVNGLDTIIGEGGVKISGGERQRLSIARALLRKPGIMIFDEATSALDSITEEEVSKTIRDISADRAHMVVLIAHRLSTVMHADVIFVLEKGSIVEKGKHEELIGLGGLYFAMWRQQIGERKSKT